MSLRILDADLDHPSDFLSHFKELELSEVQQVKLVEVIRRLTRPVEELIAESRAKKAAARGGGGATTAAPSPRQAPSAPPEPPPPASKEPNKPPPPPGPKRVMVTVSFGRGDMNDFRFYFESCVAVAETVEAFREEVRGRLRDLAGVEAPTDEALVIELKPSISYRKSIGRLAERLPLFEGTEGMDGFDVLVRCTPPSSSTSTPAAVPPDGGQEDAGPS